MKQVLFIFISLGLFSSTIAQINVTSVKNTKNITDQECPHLIFKIGNGMSRIPAIALKNISEARVEMSDFSKSNYILQKFTITILSNETHTFDTYINDGNAFTEKTKAILRLIKPNDIIMISGISAVDQSGNIVYVQERNFGLY